MRKITRIRPTPGAVLCLLAMFVAVGGVAFGQATGTPPATAIAEALHALSADRAPISHVDYVVNSEEVPRHNLPNNSHIQVNCPTGTKVIAGGLTTTGAGGSRDFELRYSGPTNENGWAVGYGPGTSFGGNDAGETVRGIAICAGVFSTFHQAD